MLAAPLVVAAISLFASIVRPFTTRLDTADEYLLPSDSRVSAEVFGHDTSDEAMGPVSCLV